MAAAMTDVETSRRNKTEIFLEERTQLTNSMCAHIVKTGPNEDAAAKVLAARILGVPIEALCGYVWVPNKNPRDMPICPKCKEIYELYRMADENLNESVRE